MSDREIRYELPPDAALGLETWHAARRERRLLVPHCRACGRSHWYPRPFCPFCLGPALDWPESRGTGRVYSFSVMRRAPIPYAIAFVTLEEGVTMMTNIVGSPLDAIGIGRRVRLDWRAGARDEPFPVFTLA